jgi:hypothetical protein
MKQKTDPDRVLIIVFLMSNTAFNIRNNPCFGGSIENGIK